MFTYKLFDGFNWYELTESETRLDPAESESLAETEVEDWDYEGIAHRVDIYESEDDGVDERIGFVVKDGREYHCPTCHTSFPHPPSELAVCHCGNVVSEPDPEPEYDF